MVVYNIKTKSALSSRRNGGEIIPGGFRKLIKRFQFTRKRIKVFLHHQKFGDCSFGAKVNKIGSSTSEKGLPACAVII